LDGNSALCISTMSTAPFGVGGRPRKPRPTVETVPRICVGDLASLPLGGLAREATVRVVVNGRLEALDVVCDARNYGGDGPTFFLCPACSRKGQPFYFRGERLGCRRGAGVVLRRPHTRRR